MGEIGRTGAENKVLIITGVLVLAIVLVLAGILLNLPEGLGLNLFGDSEKEGITDIDSNLEQTIVEPAEEKEEIKLEESKVEEVEEEQEDVISILINNGDEKTRDIEVELLLKSNQYNRCKLWNENEDYYNAKWFDFEKEEMTKDWKLTSTGGEKIVYFQCKDENDTLTSVVSDSIYYEKDYPSGSGGSGGSSGSRVLEPTDLALTVLTNERDYSTDGIVHILFSVKNAKVCELYEEDGFGITVDCDLRSYSDFPLSNGDGVKTIYFKAVNVNKEAVISKEVVLLQTEIDAPTLAMTTGSDGYLNILINPDERETPAIIDYYEIYRKTGTAPGYSSSTKSNSIVFKKIADVTGNSYTDTQVKEGNTYTYYVTAVDIAGRESNRSEYITHSPIGQEPTVELVSPQNGQTTYGMVMAGYIIDDDISSILDVDILLNGNKYPVGDKRVSSMMHLTVLQLTYEGEYTLQIRVIDNAGQRGFSDEITFYWYESQSNNNGGNSGTSTTQTTKPETDTLGGGINPDVKKPAKDPEIPGTPSPDPTETREQPNNPAPNLS